ncbi:DUF1289 domain-containing protein [Shewanella sp. Choline-02u-19]|jgi:predicted Fe-S protein YdhL (DUF1289 family)|uniref:DUF1289 domain-containing protein n=1 Tax=Shewanella TaxID=22 RepID=UPI000C326056|nr:MULTISPECIES: DUF1289 domain-containing protein [Shewanella]MCL1058807.1 DUF1289 domain-containing protein [Shewanella gelidimarina]PKG55970.1 DUF1289 domain-containing protein [Shewanella sp. GutDb-MelDb]PKG76586.1 DUF1289 domain-containing protein [Shewanella sp. GutCb]PKH56218.1 DUF1289 domain-containing protein [Shewanella sp. Bg11-22]PKI28712.1 DUF1289 domain-containing protein [Shewanella sp. Choline-02u-19]
MEQLEFFEIPSPCIGICQSDARGYCKGCLRNRDERFKWLEFSDVQKFDVIRLCKQRKRRRQLAILKAKKAQLIEERATVNPSLDFKDQAPDSLDVSDFKLD